MKIPTILTTALLLSCGPLVAQDNTSQQDASRKDTQTQPQADANQSAEQEDNIISEPSGAEPSGRPFGTNQPPGRAFSTNNPPQGKPFEDGGRPPGRAFEQEQPEVEEPSGAEQPDATNEQSEANEPAGAQSNDASDATQPDASYSTPNAAAATPGETKTSETDAAQSGVEAEAAGAQRAGSEQIASALGSLKAGTAAGGTGQNIQLRQAIKTSIQGKQVADEYVDRLSTDLSMAFKSGEIKQEVRTELAQSLHTVLTAQPSAQAEIEQSLSRIQTIMIDNGATRPAARAVACDLHLIATELHPDLHLSVPVPR